MLILLDDGEALTVGPEETCINNSEWKVLQLTARFFGRTEGSTAFYSLAGVVGGVLRTVSRAVTAEETGGVLGRDGGVLAGPPGLGFRPRPLQDVVRVLTRSWTDRRTPE